MSCVPVYPPLRGRAAGKADSFWLENKPPKARIDSTTAAIAMDAANRFNQFPNRFPIGGAAIGLFLLGIDLSIGIDGYILS